MLTNCPQLSTLPSVTTQHPSLLPTLYCPPLSTTCVIHVVLPLDHAFLFLILESLSGTFHSVSMQHFQKYQAYLPCYVLTYGISAYINVLGILE